MLNVFAAVNNQINKKVYSQYLTGLEGVNIVCDIDYYEDFKIKFEEVRDQVNVILLHQNLIGTTRPYSVIDLVRTLAPDKRIIYIIDSLVDSSAVKSYLVGSHIYDFLVDDSSNPQLKEEFLDIVFNPRKYEDVSAYYQKSLLSEIVQEAKTEKTGKRVTKVQKPVKQVVKRVVRQNVNFKKLVLTVWDNPEFGCELAYLAAKNTDFRVQLIDLDLMAPSVDVHLKIKKYPSNITNEGTFMNSGVNIVIDQIQKNSFTPELLYEASVKRKEVNNLYVLTGNESLMNYEYYDVHSLVPLIEKAYQSFDITILLVNRSVYDLFTVAALIKSDYNIIPIRADLDKLREFNKYIVFLKDRQGIPLDKNKFVAFEYNPSLNYSEAALREVTQNNFIGKIPFSKKRVLYRNKNIPFARRIDDETRKEYFKILSYFNIVTKESFTEKIKSFFMDMTKSVRVYLKAMRLKSRRRRKK